MNQPLWPHQHRALKELNRAAKRGFRAICVTCPTGGGKTRIMAEIARRCVNHKFRVALFTHRRLLTGQASQALDKLDVDHGVMAAGYAPALFRGVQVCSVQTIRSRVFATARWSLPEADVVLIDEAHAMTGAAARQIIESYRERETFVFGFTATPVGLGKLYETLITAGVNSELRRCGAIVPCDVFAPCEPDMRGVTMNKAGEYVHKGAVRRIMQCTVFGDVFEHWRRLNPAARPTLLFAPGVPESKWFAEQFCQRGVEALHVGDDTPDEERQAAFAAHREGRVKVICSFGILREGVDLPWAWHGILLQACGALSTYLQIVGRLLRSSEGKERAILQDHSGAWHRHGSPNADRDWRLSDTDRQLARRLLRSRQRGEGPAEGICCPKCQGVRGGGPKCPHCGHEHVRSVRMVRMTDGQLKKMQGPTVKRRKLDSDDERLWTSCLYAAAHSGHTLGQARGRFAQRAGKPLPDHLPHVPAAGSLDWDRRALDVYPWLGRRKGSKLELARSSGP